MSSSNPIGPVRILAAGILLFILVPTLPATAPDGPDTAGLVETPTVNAIASSTVPTIVERTVSVDPNAAESTLDVNPTNGANIVYAMNNVVPQYSTDGGATWATSSAPWPGSDPQIRFAANGNAFYTRLGYGNSGVIVMKSTDGGATYTEVASAFDPQTQFSFPDELPHTHCGATDYARLAVDRTSTSPYANYLYVIAPAKFLTSGPVPCNDDRQIFIHSADQGLTWTGGYAVNPGFLLSQPPTVAPDGTVYWVSTATATCGSGILLNKATGGGAAFPPGTCISTPGPAGLAVIAADPTDANKLFVGFITGTGLWVTRSTNAGTSWSAAVRVSDIQADPAVGPGHTVISVSSTGRVDAEFWDNRNAAISGYSDVYYSFSLDGGTTFSNNMRVTPSTNCMGPRLCDGQNAGAANDYGGMVSAGASAQIAYAQKRPGWTAFMSTVTQGSSAATAPGAPSGLGATAGALQVQLSWTPAASDGGAPLQGYKILRGTSPGSEIPYATVGSSVSAWTDKFSMLAGTTYYYKVKAANVVGDSATSNEATATPTAGPPGATGTLQATGSLGQVSLSWSAPSYDGGSPITDYKIYRSTSSGTEVAFSQTGGPNTSYVDYDVAGTTYFYKVTAVNAIGEGPLSNEAEAVGAQPPGPPTGLTADPGDGEVRLNWQAPSSNGGSPVSSYQILCGASSAEVGFCTWSGAATTFTETGLTNGVPRYYRVAAWNGVALGAPSNEASATPAVGYPSAPTLNTATAGNGQVALAWTAPSVVGSGITSYKVYRGSTNPPSTLLASGGCTGLNGAALSCTDNTAVNGQTYYYKVSAVNAMGEGSYSNALDASPSAAVPGPLTLLTATPENGQVTLTWTDPSDGGSPITGYAWYRGTTPGGELFLYGASLGARTDYTVTNGVTYYYKVSAVNAVGEGPLSNELSATPGNLPGSLTLLTATPGNGKVTLAWTVPSDGGSPLTHYYWYRGTTPGGEQYLFASTPGAPTSTDYSVVNGTTYYYKVSATNATGEGPLSNELSATPSVVKTFTSSNIPTTGTVTNFANAQSDSDAGAEAALTEANTAVPILYTLNADSTEASSGWTTPSNGWGLSVDNQYAKATATNKLLRYGLTNPSGSGTITSVIIKAEVSILDPTPPPDDKFRLTACFSTSNCGTEGPSTGAGTTDSVISYDVTSAKPGGGAWTWTDLNNLQTRVRTVVTGSVDGNGWQVDRVWVEATSTPPAIQKLETQFLFTGVPSGTTQKLELNYRVAPSTDTFIVQIWSGTAWTTRGTALTATSATDWTYTLTTAEYQSGSPKVRFLDVTSGSTQGILYVGYARIVTD